VKRSIAVLPCSVCIRSAPKKCIYLLNISASRSDIEGMLTKKTYLIYINQINPRERWQLFVLIALQYLSGAKSSSVCFNTHIGSYWQLLWIHVCCF